MENDTQNACRQSLVVVVFGRSHVCCGVFSGVDRFVVGGAGGRSRGAAPRRPPGLAHSLPVAGVAGPGRGVRYVMVKGRLLETAHFYLT